MSKHYLDFDDEFLDIHIVGIACHASNYRLCWQLNNALNLLLERSDTPYTYWPGKSQISEHDMFKGEDEYWKCKLYLIQNRSRQGNLLVPEYREADYLLVVLNPKEAFSSEILQKLNKQSLILTAFRINPKGLKSKANLIFE